MYDDTSESPLESARAIKTCLEYLQNEALKIDLEIAAHLIGAASEAIEEWLADHAPAYEEVKTAEILQWRRFSA